MNAKKYFVYDRNPDGSKTSTKKMVWVQHADETRCDHFTDVSQEIWARECPKYGAAPLSYMYLRCEHGIILSYYRNQAISE